MKNQLFTIHISSWIKIANSYLDFCRLFINENDSLLLHLFFCIFAFLRRVFLSVVLYFKWLNAIKKYHKL